MIATVSVPRSSIERNSWPRDFALGFRLAVGGGRTSWMRLILGTIGIGLAVAVLLVFASIGHIMANQNARSSAGQPSTTVINGVSPTRSVQDDMSFRGSVIQGAYLHGAGPNSPVPPGITSLPGPNEIVISPALADLLNSDQGANLRARFPEKIVGAIGEAGLSGPADLAFYAGAGPLPPTSAIGSNAMDVYSFGGPNAQPSTDRTLLLVAVIGGVALLVPILIFVSVSSRIAGAQRDRRLAAMRLVGAGNWQVRRIAAAESLVSTGAGLVLGALAFLGLRQLAPHIDALGWSAFIDDVVPSPVLTVLVVLLVPVLAVGTVLFAMRRTIIEPLGVVRGSKPVRRRVWWRVALIVVGIGLLVAAKPVGQPGSTTWIALIGVGASALLIGVPAILPWLLERVVSRMHGGTPPWQLAIRRLQLDSGTPARVVAGVAVVLASAIAVQLMLLSVTNQYNVPSSSPADNWLSVISSSAVADQVTADLAKVPAAKQVVLVETVGAINANGPNTSRRMAYDITIASCPTIERILNVRNCVDGQGFLSASPRDPIPAKPGDTWSLIGANDWSDHPTVVGAYTVPNNLTSVTLPNTVGSGPYIGGGVVLTPGAAATMNVPANKLAEAWVLTDPSQAGATDQIASGVGNLTWQVFVSLSKSDILTVNQKSFATIRAVLDGGSLFTLLLAGVSLLVLALEQVRERRRPLAMLAAAGVPRSVLARSLLWQTAVPVVLAVVVAVGTGIGLAALVVRMASRPLQIDWLTIGLFAIATMALVFLVTALTLPALRSAMRLSALRTE